VVNFYLGKLKNEKHLIVLQDLAYELDQSKFSCTLSVINGGILLDIDPYPEQAEEFSTAEFKFYAAEHIIHKLNKKLSQVIE
jgi:hypothetical protein